MNQLDGWIFERLPLQLRLRSAQSDAMDAERMYIWQSTGKWRRIQLTRKPPSEWLKRSTDG